MKSDSRWLTMNRGIEYCAIFDLLTNLLIKRNYSRAIPKRSLINYININSLLPNVIQELIKMIYTFKGQGRGLSVLEILILYS